VERVLCGLIDVWRGFWSIVRTPRAGLRRLWRVLRTVVLRGVTHDLWPFSVIPANVAALHAIDDCAAKYQESCTDAYGYGDGDQACINVIFRLAKWRLCWKEGG